MTLKQQIFKHQKNLNELSGNEMKMTTQIPQYKGYNITTGGLGFEYVHKDYEGVYEYGGEGMEPLEYDHRAGSARTIEQCKEEIDELEIDNEQPDRQDDDFESGLEDRLQNPENY